MSVQQPLFYKYDLVQVTVVTVSGPGSVVVPAGYTKYTGEALGGGGAGFGSATGTLRASGSGGQYAKSNDKISVAPGDTIYWVVGVGGPPADSWINYNVNAAPASATTGALAKCGGSGTSGVAGVGNGAGSIGSVINFGGDGMTDPGGQPTGGGGAGASGPGQIGIANATGGNGGIDATGLSTSTPMGGGAGGSMGSGGFVPSGGGGGRTNAGVVGGAIGRVRYTFYSS